MKPEPKKRKKQEKTEYGGQGAERGFCRCLRKEAFGRNAFFDSGRRRKSFRAFCQKGVDVGNQEEYTESVAVKNMLRNDGGGAEWTAAIRRTRLL